eukprot:scaffold19538_cov21-Tisochrysis_lutea.AAC.1
MRVASWEVRSFDDGRCFLSVCGHPEANAAPPTVSSCIAHSRTGVLAATPPLPKPWLGASTGPPQPGRRA